MVSAAARRSLAISSYSAGLGHVMNASRSGGLQLPAVFGDACGVPEPVHSI